MPDKPPINAGRFRVRRHTSKTQVAHMTRGVSGTPSCKKWDEPRISHRVIDTKNDRLVGTVGNGTSLCLPEGSVRATEASDEQIIRAVVGDEHIYTGERFYQPD